MPETALHCVAEEAEAEEEEQEDAPPPPLITGATSVNAVPTTGHQGGCRIQLAAQQVSVQVFLTPKVQQQLESLLLLPHGARPGLRHPEVSQTTVVYQYWCPYPDTVQILIFNTNYYCLFVL